MFSGNFFSGDRRCAQGTRLLKSDLTGGKRPGIASEAYQRIRIITMTVIYRLAKYKLVTIKMLQIYSKKQTLITLIITLSLLSKLLKQKKEPT